MEAVLNISIPSVAAAPSLDPEGVMVSVYVGDEEYPRTDAVVAWGDLVDELVDDDANPESYLLEVAEALEAAAKDLREAVAEKAETV